MNVKGMRLPEREYELLELISEIENRSTDRIALSLLRDAIKHYHPFFSISLDTGNPIALKGGRIFFEKEIQNRARRNG